MLLFLFNKFGLIEWNFYQHWPIFGVNDFENVEVVFLKRNFAAFVVKNEFSAQTGKVDFLDADFFAICARYYERERGLFFGE